MGKLILILIVIFGVLIIRRFLLQKITVLEKKIFIFFTVAITIIMFLYISIAIQPYSLLRIIKGGKNYTIDLIKKIGIEAINQEAEDMFDDLYKKSSEYYFLNNQEQSKYPVLSNLDYSLNFVISRGNESIQPHIIIKHGTHMMPDFIYIFDRRTPPPYFVNTSNEKLEKITENIFLVTK